ncbi:hypothetical protein BH09MYX1_BH09MYX1_41800 [soil metagenome]
MARWKKSKLFYIRIGEDGEELGPYRKHELRWAIKSEKDARKAQVRGEFGSWSPYSQLPAGSKGRSYREAVFVQSLDAVRARKWMIVGAVMFIASIGLIFIHRAATFLFIAGLVVFFVSLRRYFGASHV